MDVKDIVPILESATRKVKELHWNTKVSSTHKLTDEVKDYLAEVQDELAEIVFGLSNDMKFCDNPDDFCINANPTEECKTLEEFCFSDYCCAVSLFVCIRDCIVKYYKFLKEYFDISNGEYAGGLISEVETLIAKMNKYAYLANIK